MQRVCLAVLPLFVCGCILAEVFDTDGNRIRNAQVGYKADGAWSLFRQLPDELNRFYLCEQGNVLQPGAGDVEIAAASPGFSMLRSLVPVRYASIQKGALPICRRDATASAVRFTMYKDPAGWDPGNHKRCVQSAVPKGSENYYEDRTFCPDGGAYGIWINSENAPAKPCPGPFGASYVPNAAESPIKYEWLRQSDGSHEVLMGVDYAAAGMCDGGVCTHPCGPSDKYWTWFSMTQPPDSTPSLDSATLVLDLKLLGRWEASSKAGAAVFVFFVIRWEPKTSVTNSIVLVFEPGEIMYKNPNMPDDKILLMGLGRPDGNHVFMSARAFGYPPLTEHFQTYEIDLTELFLHAKRVGAYRDSPRLSSLHPIAGVGIEVLDSSTVYINYRRMYFKRGRPALGALR